MQATTRQGGNLNLNPEMKSIHWHRNYGWGVFGNPSNTLHSNFKVCSGWHPTDKHPVSHVVSNLWERKEEGEAISPHRQSCSSALNNVVGVAEAPSPPSMRPKNLLHFSIWVCLGASYQNNGLEELSNSTLYLRQRKVNHISRFRADGGFREQSSTEQQIVNSDLFERESRSSLGVVLRERVERIMKKGAKKEWCVFCPPLPPLLSQEIHVTSRRRKLYIDSFTCNDMKAVPCVRPEFRAGNQRPSSRE